MKPWEFIITCKEDLPVFADLLAEWDHPGEVIVRWLIKNDKWPDYRQASMTTILIWYKQLTDHEGENMIPGKLLSQGAGHTRHQTASGAIWSVICTFLYEMGDNDRSEYR